MASDARAPRRQRRAFALLAIAGVGLAAGAVALVSARREVAEWALLRQLRAAGLEAASVSVEEVGLGGARLRDLRIGDGDLELARLELLYSPASLLGGRAGSVRGEGLRVRGEWREGTLRLGALDALLAPRGAVAPAASPGSRTGGAGLPALPAERIELAEASFRLDTEDGPCEVGLSLELGGDGSGVFTLGVAPLDAFGVVSEELTLSGRVQLGPERLAVEIDPAPIALRVGGEAGGRRVEGTTPTLRGSRARDATWELRAQGGALALPDLAVAGEGLDVLLALAPGGALPGGSLRVEEIRDLAESPRFRPVSLQADLTPESDALRFSGLLRGPEDRPRIHVAGSFDPAAAEGRAELHMEPLEFAEEGLSPGDVLPVLAALLPRAQGSVEAHGELRFQDAKLSGFVDLGLRELALQTPAARLEQLNGVVRVDGPWPPFIPRGQLLSMSRVDFGLELTRGVVSYGVGDDGVVQVDTAAWSFAGGSIRTAGSFDLFAEERDVLLRVDDVDLAELLALVNLDGLSGRGRLSGELPLTLHPGGTRIRGARLESSEEGGWLFYRPEGGAAALGAVGEMALDDLLAALKNFQFHHLSLSIDGEAQRELVVKVRLAGANPKHRDGQPYDLNLNLDAALADLVRKAAASYEIPRAIEEKLNEIAERGARVDRGGEPGIGSAP